VEGLVELLANGSGFVRVTPPEPSDDDVYISAAQVKRCELVGGDRVSGPRRPPHRSERFPSLVRIDTVNGRPADELSDRGRFDDLPAVFPIDRFTLGSDDPTLKAVESLTPFGRGSRVTITGGSWSGKSHLLEKLSAVLAAQENVTVFVALAGVRPEELSEWNEGSLKPAAELTFSASSEAQDNAVELVVDQARRLAARGSDAIVLIDSLDGLHPLNARRAIAAARKLKSGGSLTVIATSSKPLGGETTVIALDAELAMANRHPALDLAASGTLRPELLVGEAGVKAIAKERAKLQKP
jgi:transcription termination factor Rho